MIEITTYPEKRIFYIPFDYKGIPENMFLEKIEIRKPPEEVIATKPVFSFDQRELTEGLEEREEAEYFDPSEQQYDDDDEFSQRPGLDDIIKQKEEELLKKK
jgi:hypothetical protein